MQLVVAHKGPEVHLLRRTGQLLDLGLVLLVFLQLLVKAALPLLHIKAVIAAVKLRLALVDLNAALDHLVQKIAVVADGQHRTLEPEQIVLQPLRGVQVQMVGGLVQQQNVRVLQNQPGQVHPGLFPAGQGVEGLGAHGCGDVQAVCHPVSLRLHLIAAQTAEIIAQAVVLPQQGRGLVRLHHQRQLVHPVADGVETAVGVLQHVLGGPALRIDRDLGDQAHPFGRRDHDLALVAGELTGENAEKGGLAAAVVA